VDHFRQHYISEEGRVIDPADGRHHHLEGQSYALFFALVNDDRETFARLLDWTERQLARGDLRLPAILALGQAAGRQPGVLDANSASDSDLWIAYSLLEAGRL
jgi:endoglucanase